MGPVIARMTEPRTVLHATLHGRRKGKPLRTYQASLTETLLPRLALDTTRPIDPKSLFREPVRALQVEIGFGGGEHLARCARENPDVGFLGCEPFINGVAKLLAQIERDGLGNVRVHAGDAREVLAALPPACLDRIAILYPDPWPKRRQRKRRFVSEETLRLMAACLKPGGELRFASDIDDCTGDALAAVLACGGFAWTATHPADWRQAWDGWLPTRYEEKARAAGRDSVYLTFLRR